MKLTQSNHCTTCVSHNLIGAVPPHCEWYRHNVTFGGKSAEECPYYSPTGGEEE